MEADRSKMSEDQVALVVADTARLRALQERPDPPEALARIPVLELADLDM